MKYIRPNGRCPADEFLDGCDEKFQKKFKGSFDALTQLGTRYYNRERFKPLQDAGKPLWEFKEFDNRLYCRRTCAGNFATVILLCGWEKQKKGKDKRETIEINRAQQLLAEYLNQGRN